MLQQTFVEVSVERPRKLTSQERFFDEMTRQVLEWAVFNAKPR